MIYRNQQPALEDIRLILALHPRELPAYVAAIYLSLRDLGDVEAAGMIYRRGLKKLVEGSKRDTLTTLYENLRKIHSNAV